MGLKVKKWFLSGLICLLLLPAGCQPEGIIPPDDMETLFAEFYMADASIEQMNMSSSRAHGVHPDSLKVYQPILEKHGFTEEMYRESLAYYLHRPTEMVSMFKHVRLRLEKEADQPVLQKDADEEEEAMDVEAGPSDEKIREGTEPPLEQLDRKEPPEKKTPRKPKMKRKKMTENDLKRLEEELK